MKKWIWITEKDEKINRRICFWGKFSLDDREHNVSLKISAITKYRCWINGEYIGSGSVRNAAGIRTFDRYDLSSGVHSGTNLFAVEVWNYGLSTYQFIYEPPGLCFEIKDEIQSLLESNDAIFVAENTGHISDAPKRNVNLGFTDYYDARLFPNQWFRDPSLFSVWEKAKCLPHNITENWTEKDRPIRHFDKKNKRAECIVDIQDVEKGCQAVTVNLREALFPGRRDANETTMAVILGTVLSVEKDAEGEISFPNQTWNGIIGSFSLAGREYHVTDETRDHIKVNLNKGDNLLVIKAAGTFDDLYCHLELCFKDKVQIGIMDKPTFFAIGPIARVEEPVDGRGQKKNKDEYIMEIAGEIPVWNEVFRCIDFKELYKEYRDDVIILPEKDIYHDAYLLSLERKERILCNYAIRENNQGLLWDNEEVTVISGPEMGDYRRIILDFGSICVGKVNIKLKAKSGTIIDLYGFENYYGYEIDHTLGLNNAIRYICKEGWQEYNGMARIGFRYLLITIRNTDRPVYIRDIHIINETYSVTNAGKFECSDALLNRIFEMCKETNLLCTEDSFTDCPTYEQAFWIGDAYISTVVNRWLFGDTEYQLHNATLAVNALRNTELMNALTPTDWNTSIPMWMVNWILSVFYISEQNSRKMVEEYHDTIVKVLGSYSRFIDEDKGFNIHSWNLLDWAPLDISNNGVVTAQEALLGMCYEMTGRYDIETGRLSEGKALLKYRDILFEHINSVMWDYEKKAYYDGWTEDNGFSKTYSIQTHLLIYLSDMYKKERTHLLEQYIKNIPNDFVKVGSPFILFYLYETYIKLGKKADVFMDIKKRWSEMLKYDSTTCWEVFPGYYENSRTRSYCHSWSSSPAYFLMKYMTGLEMLNDESKRVTVRNIPDELDWCRAVIPTPYGRIRIKWEREKGAVNVLLDIPEEIEYTDNGDKNQSVKVRTFRSERASKDYLSIQIGEPGA